MIRRTICLMTGRMMVHVAVLEVSSVMTSVMAHIMMVMSGCGRLERVARRLPMATDKPDLSHPLAMAKPPPRSRMTPQLTRSWVTFQSSNIGDVFKFLGSAGMRKKNKTTSIAGTESFMSLVVDSKAKDIINII